MARSPHPTRLTPTEQEILEYLRERAGQAIPAEELYVWLYGYNGTPGITMVNTYIKRIRDQIGRGHIRTIWGRGFVFSTTGTL